MAYSKIILNGETLMDVTQDTVDAGNLVSGNTATKNDGTKVTGSIVSRSASDLTASGSIVTVPAGNYDTQVTKSISGGTATTPAKTITTNPTIAVNTSGVVTANYNGSSSITPTVTAGYISQGTAGIISTTGTSTSQLTSIAATTYYPSTADQMVSSQRWLVGAQTIKSVTTTNLTAANIVNGTVVKVGDAADASRITQITGTYSGIIPTGTSNITSNGIYDIASYASANVSVAGGGGVSYTSLTITPTNEEQFFDGYTSIGDPIYSSHMYKATQAGGEQLLYSEPLDLNERYLLYYNLSKLSTDAYTVLPFKEGSRGFLLSTSTDEFNPLGSYFYVTNSYIQTNNLAATNYEGMYYTFSIYKASFSAFAPVTVNKMTGIEDPYYAIKHGMLTSKTIFAIGSTNADPVYAYSQAAVSSFLNDMSIISSRFFEGIFFSGTTVRFSNATLICSSAFIFPEMPTTNSLITMSFYNVSSINRSAFYRNINLSRIKVSSCTYIDIGAFQYCSNLSFVDFPSCISISNYAFYECSKLSLVNFPVCTYVAADAFEKCSKLTLADFYECEYVGKNAFSSCYSLSEVYMSKCSIISNAAFFNCSSLYYADVSGCEIVGSSAFNKCSRLANISMPICYSIGSNAFASCSSMSTAYFGGSVDIREFAFNNCYSLTTVSIPNCTSISNYVFSRCFNLLSLYLDSVSSVPPLASISAFYSTPISGYTTSTGGVYGSIFVPSSLYNDFITATNWSAFSSRIVSV